MITTIAALADTTLAFDRTVKAGLYARAGIAEYWLVDVAGRRLIVHRQPEAGQYADITTHEESEAVAPLASPGFVLSIRSVFHG